MDYHFVCQTSDVEAGASKGFIVNDINLLVVNHNNNFYIYRNECPHLNLALEWMPDQFLDNDKQYIQCATHGALFRIDTGNCIAGPCLGESLQPMDFRINEDTIEITIT